MIETHPGSDRLLVRVVTILVRKLLCADMESIKAYVVISFMLVIFLLSSFFIFNAGMVILLLKLATECFTIIPTI